jgi:hypothetical protein
MHMTWIEEFVKFLFETYNSNIHQHLWEESNG